MKNIRIKQTKIIVTLIINNIGTGTTGVWENIFALFGMNPNVQIFYVLNCII